MKAPIPSNEQERLEVLRDSNLLDTPPEEAFDRICRLAAQFFKVPIAAISLLAEDRQFFKSSIGVSVRETCRDWAFCAHTILGDNPLVVLDAQTDPRFSANPLVTGHPRIRFYCGAPIRTREGLPLGSVCVIDTQPRESVSQASIAVLLECAAQVNSEIEHRRASRERLRENDEILSGISSSCPVGIFRADLCGNVSYANARVQEIWEMSEDEIKGMGWMARVHPDDAGPLLETWCTANTQGSNYEHEYRLVRPNGGIRWIHGRSSVVHHCDRTARTIGTVDDVTERKQLEEERRRQEELIRRTAEEREKARTSAELANLTKSIFLANASHELRTPLNGVLGMTELLLQTRLNSEQLELTESIRQSGTALLTLVNDLLDLSRMESGKLNYHPAPFDIRNTIRHAAGMISREAEEKGLDVVSQVGESVPEWLVGDEDRIRQIIVNYLNNAVKFTERGSVYLSVERVSDESSPVTVLISVRDTGAGIPLEIQSNLFKLFWQSDASTTRKQGGLGLGLALSSRLAEMMGGSVGVQSASGIGSTFWVKLPLQNGCPNCRSGVAEPGRAISLSGLRVLVAEDNAINQKLITKMLAKLGCHADLASNGLAAVNMFGQNSYDVVLMDCQMPELDGYEATRLIRNREKDHSLSPTPVLALTAHGMTGDRQQCLECGMDDHLVKPLKLEALQQALETWSRQPSKPTLKQL